MPKHLLLRLCLGTRTRGPPATDKDGARSDDAADGSGNYFQNSAQFVRNLCQCLPIFYGIQDKGRKGFLPDPRG
jgi:hypothetical protein